MVLSIESGIRLRRGTGTRPPHPLHPSPCPYRTGGYASWSTHVHQHLLDDAESVPTGRGDTLPGVHPLLRFHPQRPLGVLFDHFALEEHGVMFDTEPGFDEVVVVFAGRVAGLAGMVDGERGFGVGQVDDL